MADYVKHFEIFDNIYRILVPGYDPGAGPIEGTFGGLGKAMIDVIVGDEKAAVWDTGNGDIDLLGYIRMNITDKPLIVFNSHGHIDHANGNNQFEEVWINEADAEGARNVTRMKKGFKGHPRHFLLQNARECKYNYLEDGQVFDLGGRTLKILFAPGHSRGEIVAVESKSKVLFSGDAILKRVGLSVTTRQAYKEVLERIKKEDFDCILSGHWDLPLDREQIDRFIKLLDEFEPGKTVERYNMLGGHFGINYQFYCGSEFADPEFACVNVTDPEKFYNA